MSSAFYRRYLLAVLLLILTFNYVDRLALGLLLQDIKSDLQLSDTQLGFLTGIAFALFYAVMGIPIARWADRGNRITIISLTTALWSLAVALCGVAGNFLQLLACRILVAVGEAGCIPPAHSLIPDQFNRAERPRAAAIYMLGGSLSGIFGYFGAGWLNELYGWRTTFIVLAVPGLVLAVLAALTLHEPRRQKNGSEPVTAGSVTAPTLQEVSTTLWANRTFRHLLLSYSVVSLFGSGIGQWLPAFFMRSHGLTTGELGAWFAVLFGLGGTMGTYWGGALASRYAASDERLQLRSMAALYCAYAVISSFIYLAPNGYFALAAVGIATTGGAAAVGPIFATIQTLVPEHMRAVSVALIYLIANLIGMGAGPFLVGVLSDALHASLGQDSLRYALLALCPGYLWGAWHLWRASATVIGDLQDHATRHS
jgi:MFS family permease